MSVSIKVSEETARIIQGKVEQGLYPDLETAFAEATRLLDEKELHRLGIRPEPDMGSV